MEENEYVELFDVSDEPEDSDDKDDELTKDEANEPGEDPKADDEGAENDSEKNDDPSHKPRNLEADAAYAQLRRLQELQNAFAKSNGFNSFEEMQKETARQRQAELEEQIKEGDLSAIDPLVQHKIATTPEIQVVRELQESMQRQQAELQIAQDIAELNAHFPEAGIKTLDDIAAMEHGEEIIEAAAKGIPLYKAFGYHNIDRITEKKTEAAKERARLATQKNHMKPIGGVGGSGVHIPKDVYRQYKEFNPKATDAEIAAHYKKNGGK